MSALSSSAGHRRLRLRATAALCAGLTLVLGTAACSSSGASGRNASTAASGPSRLDAALVKLIPAAYKSKGALVLPVYNTPPYMYTDTSGNAQKGLLLDLMSEFTARTGLRVMLTPARFDAVQPGLEAGRFDIAAPLGDFPQRHATLNILDITAVKTAYLVKASGALQPDTLAKLCGTTMTAQAGAFSATSIDVLAKWCTGHGYKTVKSLILPDQQSEVLALRSGRADVLTDQGDSVRELAAESKGELKMYIPTDIADLPGGTSIVGIASSKASNLAPLLTAFMQKLKADGTYDRLWKKWGETDNMLTAAQIAVNTTKG